MAFEAWFLWPQSEAWGFEWEPLIGMILAVIAYIGIEAKEHSASLKASESNSEPIAVDIRLFEEFSKLFPSGSIAFFRDHDFFNSFSPEPMQTLFHYVDHWTTVEHEFINPVLQEGHRVFREKAIEFARALAKNTTTNRNGHATVSPSGHQGGSLPDWAQEEARELNTLAAEFTQAHQEFIRNARRIMH
jgi:hypothetical protein